MRMPFRRRRTLPEQILHAAAAGAGMARRMLRRKPSS